MSKFDNRIGERKINTFGSEMVIVKYLDSNNVQVKFIDSDNYVLTTYDRFKKGSVKNVYDKSVFEVGFIGEGKYKVSENGKQTKQYLIWKSMLQRCYYKKLHDRCPTYKESSVYEEWHNFQNFAKWFDENYYTIDGERMELDKDILVKGNKTYSPDTCIFVPHRINTLFIKCDSSRGELPLGVCFDKVKKKYEVRCNDYPNKQKRIGRYSTPESAFFAYKAYKEQLIKQIANEYREKIPYNLYEVMMNYTIEIDD